MKDEIQLKDIVEDRNFWLFFYLSSYPNAYDEQKDMMLSEYIEENFKVPYKWIDQFTKYNQEIIDRNDGYEEKPRYLKVDIKEHCELMIEFHPGDTIYYLNNIEIGCTGPHYKIHVISWKKLKEIVNQCTNQAVVLQLLLPMVKIYEDEYDEARKIISECLARNCFEFKDNKLIVEFIMAAIK